jgi:hypothetical protein
MRDGCRFAPAPCEGWIEPGTDPSLPCPACWDAFNTGQVYRRGGEAFVTTARVEGRMSTGVKVFHGWERIGAAPVPEVPRG